MCNQASIKAITRHMVGIVGGPKIAAKICDVSEAEISYWCNDNHTRFIPIDHLMDLNAAAGDLFLKEWARQRNFDLVAREPIESQAASVIKTIGHFSRATGELEFTTLEAAEDNQFTPNEKRRIRDTIAPVKDYISHLEQAIS